MSNCSRRIKIKLLYKIHLTYVLLKSFQKDIVLKHINKPINESRVDFILNEPKITFF